MSALATPDELVEWWEDAQAAVDLLPGRLAATWLRALAAQPARPRRGERLTWYLEEAERLQKARVRDGFPATDDEAPAWRDRQDRREAAILALLEQHTAALVEAASYVRRTGVWAASTATARRPAGKAPRRKPTAAALALATLTDSTAA